MLRTFALVACVGATAMIAGCAGYIQSAAGPTGRYYKAPKEPETLMVGVVNGLWECDPAKNEARLAKNSEYLLGIDPVAVREKCQVRVGYGRGYFIPIPIPVGNVIVPLPLTTNRKATFSEYVLLPDDWEISRQGVVSDGRTVNVGDILEVRAQVGRLADVGVRLVRKCDDPPVAGEPKEWAIGCKEYREFNKRGYAGETYFFSFF